VKNARQALAIILGWWQTTQETQKKTSIIAETVTQHTGCVVGHNCTIGENTILYPHVTLYPNTHIGTNVIIHAGAVIGADGFGFYQHNGQHKKIPHIGSVYIEDDVEIGANTTIDRGCLGETRIGQGSKIDNLVQIGHNVKIGKHCIIVSQTGISGSTQLGDYVTMGGQVGVIGHLKIGDRVMFKARSVVTKSISEAGTYTGYPARPLMEGHKMLVLPARIPELIERVRELEKKIAALEGDDAQS
jgi:UDP-3-O-[3-hydroxymyristoyl] glucosamine N-acyltransferase